MSLASAHATWQKTVLVTNSEQENNFAFWVAEQN